VSSLHANIESDGLGGGGGSSGMHKIPFHGCHPLLYFWHPHNIIRAITHTTLMLSVYLTKKYIPLLPSSVAWPLALQVLAFLDYFPWPIPIHDSSYITLILDHFMPLLLLPHSWPLHWTLPLIIFLYRLLPVPLVHVGSPFELQPNFWSLVSQKLIDKPQVLVGNTLVEPSQR
jgi:hypothetical protein